MRPGIKDPEVLAWEKGALLLTTDKDFGELIFRPRLLSTGVLLLRLEGLPPLEKENRVAWALKEHGVDMVGAFSVLNGKRLRIRR